MISYSGGVCQLSATIELKIHYTHYMYFGQWCYLSMITSSGCATSTCMLMSYYSVNIRTPLCQLMSEGAYYHITYTFIAHISISSYAHTIVQCPSVCCIYHTQCALPSAILSDHRISYPLTLNAHSIRVTAFSVVSYYVELWDEDGNEMYCCTVYNTR